MRKTRGIASISGAYAEEATAFSVWKTLSVGGATKDELLARLEKRCFYISNWAKDIMEQPAFATSAEPHEISFVKLKVRDLGFTKLPTTQELFDEERLASRGLELCHPEDAFYLRESDTDQPRGTLYWVASPPVADSDGSPDVFLVGRSVDGGRWLRAGIAVPDDHWSLEGQLIFKKRNIYKIKPDSR